MKSKLTLVTFSCLLLATTSLGQRGRGRGGGQPARGLTEVTVEAIPGVVAAGVEWSSVWSGWGIVADGIMGTSDGSLLVAQEDLNTVMKLDTNDQASVFIANTRGGGSLSADRQGRILAVQRLVPRTIGVLSPEPEVVADTFNNAPVGDLGRLNDLAADNRGGAYFTVAGGAYYASADGEVTQFGEDLRTNGIVLNRDEDVLYVTNRGVVVAFDIQADGSVTNQRDFATLQDGGGGDGIAIDGEGRLYVTAGPGVQVFSEAGAYLGVIPTPRRVISTAFAGEDKQTLYVVGMGFQNPDGSEYQGMSMTIFKLPMVAQGYLGRAK